MNINPNQAKFQAEYFRNLYTDQSSNNAEQPKQNHRFPDSLQDERNIAIISEEAQRLQHSTRAYGSNESSLDQQRDILIPGQDQVELKLEVGIEVQSENENSSESYSAAEIEAQGYTDNALERPAISQAENIEEPSNEQAELTDNEQNVINENNQDSTGTEANINNLNNSSQLQAYASAANVNQASYIVNYKV